MPLPPVTELAVVVIDQQLRAEAAPTVAFFGQQDVAVKVISGDNAATVGAIAARAGSQAPTTRSTPVNYPTPWTPWVTNSKPTASSAGSPPNRNVTWWTRCSSADTPSR